MNVTASLAQKNNMWYAVISYPDPTDPKQTKRKQKWISTKIPVKSGNTTHKAEAKEAKEKILEDFKRQLKLNDNTMLFSAWLLQWLDDTKASREESTNYSYRKQITGTIAPYFDARHIRLCDVSVENIQQFYNYKMYECSRTVKPGTVLKYHANITKALQYAVITHRLNENPADNVALPKDDTVFTPDFYTAEELKTLLSNINGSKIETPVFLAAWFGLRRGEIIGLHWSGIDFDRKILSVSGVIRDKGANGTRNREMYYCPAKAKTSKSIRSFPMSEACIDYLRKVKAAQDFRKQTYPNYNHVWDDFVCVRDNGDIIPLERLTRDFATICERSGLKVIRFHDLRHTNISLLIDGGATFAEAEAWAGHSNIRMTAHYTHAVKGKEHLSGILETALS